MTTIFTYIKATYVQVTYYNHIVSVVCDSSVRIGGNIVQELFNSATGCYRGKILILSKLDESSRTLLSVIESLNTEII